jgi:hypothetical protein
MNIILNEQAKRLLESGKIKNDVAGVFEDKNLFVWFKQINGEFDCGEEPSFSLAFKHLKT